MGRADGGCWVTQTTGALMAQGTVTGVLLAVLVWAGVGLVGLMVLWMLILMLWAILCSLLQWLLCGTCSMDCGPCCDDPGPCCPGGCCPGGCCPGGGCCGGSSGGGGCGDCGCGGGGGTGGGGTSSGGGGGGDCACVGPVGSGMAAGTTVAFSAVPASTAPKRRDLAHHPDLPRYEQDVYRVTGTRLCIGCFTTYPVFLVATLPLFLAQPGVPAGVAIGTGSLLASLQIVSSLGRATTRWRKATVKAALGVGLALIVYGVLISALAPWQQWLALSGALCLAMLSAVPRALRMRRAACPGDNCRRNEAS